jgi:catechol 2,3-dioxygenase-like lactoylglutathione lyase family enzyme
MEVKFHHVNVTVPRELEDAAKHFYEVVMGLTVLQKPEELRGRGGAWYQLGQVQLHLSIERGSVEGGASKRHICYQFSDIAEAESRFREAGVEIIPDDQPMHGWPRFYVRDPGGNMLEIAQS